MESVAGTRISRHIRPAGFRCGASEGGTAVRGFDITVQYVLDRARRLPAGSWRTGRRSALMGALLLAVSTATVWASGNTAPRITSITGSASVTNPGKTLTVNGSFTDPDVGDSHTVFIYWSGGAVYVKDKVQLPIGQTTFQVKHTYTEPLPPTNIKIVVTDHQRPFGSNDNSDGAGWD